MVDLCDSGVFLERVFQMRQLSAIQWRKLLQLVHDECRTETITWRRREMADRFDRFDNEGNGGGSFLIGLITGSAIGVALAIYFAPRLLTLRQRVTDSTTGLRNAASEHFQDVATRVADVAERVADVADDVTRRGQAARDDVADAVARGAHEVGLGAREVERFAKASKTGHGAARS
jgi:gas vesicle protein